AREAPARGHKRCEERRLERSARLEPLEPKALNRASSGESLRKPGQSGPFVCLLQTLNGPAAAKPAIPWRFGPGVLLAHHGGQAGDGTPCGVRRHRAEYRIRPQPDGECAPLERAFCSPHQLQRATSELTDMTRLASLEPMLQRIRGEFHES